MPTRLRLLTAFLCLVAPAPAFTAGPPARPGLSLGALHGDAADCSPNGGGVTPNTRQVILLVLPGSAAEKTGLKRGDVLQRVDGRDVPTAEDLRPLLDRHKPGDIVTVEVSRGKGTATLRLPL